LQCAGEAGGVTRGPSKKGASQPAGSQHFYDKVGSIGKTLKLYEGSFHDLLNDINKGVVLQDIRDWINARLGTTSAAPAQAHGIQR
jgi:alpha-beta hydrolase superfamily lysophospholipase